MSQLVHAVSRVRAMESQLLTQNAVDRMISAESFDDAYAVLDDLGYAQESSYFRDTKDYEGVLEMGLYSSLQIFKSFGLESQLQILTVLWDIQNILLALQAKDKGESGDGLEKEMIPYGYYSDQEIVKAVFEGQGNTELMALLSPLKHSSEDDRDSLLEFSLFQQAQEKTNGNKFLKNFISRVQQGEQLKKEILTATKEELLPSYPLFSVIISSAFEKKTEEEKITHLEILLDESMVQFLKDSSMGKIDGIEPLFSFFWRKERNARVIRSILLAKKAGISPEDIKAEFASFIF